MWARAWPLNCFSQRMSVTSLSDLSRQHMLSILGYNSANQSGNASALSIGNASSGSSKQLSPFAQMLTELQQVEQSNPANYAKMTQQISTNLAAASSTAKIRGNSALASQLTSLSKDFASASQSGQMPNVTDLAGAIQMPASSITPSSTSPTAAQMNPLQIIGTVIGKVAGL